ncbi:DJ-1/PfpI family protein [Streptomyces sp. 4N509B]|uniref:DJ-1/PfpI family protein n=1 Tax=Streptomyces sp. 4N509B TaxID=3457413 RepID=UPI003FD03E1B
MGHDTFDRRTLLRGATLAGAAGVATATTGLAATSASASTASTTASATASTASSASSAATASRHTGPLRIHVVLFDGVEEMDFAAPYYVLGLAAGHSPDGGEIHYVTADGSRSVTASQGTRVRVGHRWAPEEADVLVVPGGGFTDGDGPGVGAEIRRGVLPRALAEAPRPGLTIASVCTGSVLLGAAGLLRGRPCTTHHGAWDSLEEYGGVPTRARVVDDGDLVTAGGITSGLELSLWLARRALGPDVALHLESMLEYEARGTVWTAT